LPQGDFLEKVNPEISRLASAVIAEVIVSEIYMPAIDFELQIKMRPRCGWVEYFFTRLPGSKMESLTISSAIQNKAILSDEQWSNICNWIKNVATNLKRLVIQDH